MIEMKSRNDILKDLLINEAEELERLIPLIKKLVRIKERTGEPYIISKEKFTQRESIALYLIGKYFSYELGKSDSTLASNKEISKNLSLGRNVTNARLKDLEKDRLVERIERGKWIFNMIELEDFLKNLSKRKKIGD